MGVSLRPIYPVMSPHHQKLLCLCCMSWLVMRLSDFVNLSGKTVSRCLATGFSKNAQCRDVQLSQTSLIITGGRSDVNSGLYNLLYCKRNWGNVFLILLCSFLYVCTKEALLFTTTTLYGDVDCVVVTLQIELTMTNLSCCVHLVMHREVSPFNFQCLFISLGTKMTIS